VAPYIRPEREHVQHAYTTLETFLEKLAIETAHMATRTGLEQDALVMYVLTGLKLLLPRVRVREPVHTFSLPGGKQVLSGWAEVQFLAKDLAYEELRDVYSALRRHVGGKGTEGLTEDQQFWDLVKSRGGPPANGVPKDGSGRKSGRPGIATTTAQSTKPGKAQRESTNLSLNGSMGRSARSSRSF
jgi:hypothetical protein